MYSYNMRVSCTWQRAKKRFFPSWPRERSDPASERLAEYQIDGLRSERSPGYLWIGCMWGEEGMEVGMKERSKRTGAVDPRQTFFLLTLKERGTVGENETN